MADWPLTLPQDQFLGLTEQRQDARLRTPMDAGPAKVRRRFTAATVRVQAPVVLTGAQKIALDAFYKTTLLEGSLPFNWEHPTTDAPVSFRFGPTVYSLRMDKGGAPNDRVWTGTLDLEILP